MKKTREAHWDAAYARTDTTAVSWYQPTPLVSLEMITALHLSESDPILDVGGGTSSLAAALVDRGYQDVSVLDVSSVALGRARQSQHGVSVVTHVHADVLEWQPQRTYALWHDRAAFHFLVDADSQRRYMQTLRTAIGRIGAVMLATFALDGPERCSGLPVARYAPEDLLRLLGPEFQIADVRREVHQTPGGVQQAFTWVVAQRAR